MPSAVSNALLLGFSTKEKNKRSLPPRRPHLKVARFTKYAKHPSKQFIETEMPASI